MYKTIAKAHDQLSVVQKASHSSNIALAQFALIQMKIKKTYAFAGSVDSKATLDMLDIERVVGNFGHSVVELCYILAKFRYAEANWSLEYNILIWQLHSHKQGSEPLIHLGSFLDYIFHK